MERSLLFRGRRLCGGQDQRRFGRYDKAAGRGVIYFVSRSGWVDCDDVWFGDDHRSVSGPRARRDRGRACRDHGSKMPAVQSAWFACH
jgi:hypothetical protein